MNRIHTITVPYAVMKACPMSWVQRVHIHKGSTSNIYFATFPLRKYLFCKWAGDLKIWCKYSIEGQRILSANSTRGLGQVPWPPLGHDGPQGPEGHEPVLDTHADCCRWSKPMWVDILMILYFCILQPLVADTFCCLPVGSVSSCDAFLNVFQSHGLKPEVICPCATSPEALTVAIRRSSDFPLYRKQVQFKLAVVFI